MTLIHRKYVGEEFWFDPEAEDFHIVKSEHCGEISWHVWDAKHRGSGPYETLEEAHTVLRALASDGASVSPLSARGG